MGWRVALIPLVALAQSGSSRPATYITKEEVETVNSQPGVDRQIRVVDIGSENFAVGIVHRGKTGVPGAGGGAGARGRRLRLRNRAASAPRRLRQRARPPVCTTTSRPRATTSCRAKARW